MPAAKDSAYAMAEELRVWKIPGANITVLIQGNAYIVRVDTEEPLHRWLFTRIADSVIYNKPSAWRAVEDSILFYFGTEDGAREENRG
jgi:uncharacterized protein (UPF0248 family)